MYLLIFKKIKNLEINNHMSIGPKSPFLVDVPMIIDIVRADSENKLLT